MSRVIAHGATDQSTVVRLAYGNGTLRTDVTAATGNIAMQYRREGGNVTDAGTVGNLASGAAAHTDAGIVHLTGAYYRVDPPDAAWASGAAGVLVTVSGDDITCIGAYHPLGPQAADVQAWGGNATNISVSVDGLPTVALGDGVHGGSSATVALDGLTILANLTVSGSVNVADELTVGVGTSLGDVTMASQTVAANLTIGNMVATGTITRGGTALSTYAGGDTSGTTTLLSRLTATRAGYIDNLQGGNVALESTAQSILTDTAEIGAAGAGLTEAGGTGDHLTALPWNAAWDAEVQSEVADGLAAFWTSPATLVDLIWDEPTIGHATAGTTGKALTDAGSAGDPWSTALPGAYGNGTAGYIVGTNLDAAVSTRSDFDAGNDTVTLAAATHTGAVIPTVTTVTNAGNATLGNNTHAGNFAAVTNVQAASLGTQAKADVNAEVDTALTDYDGPTNAEMEARTLPAASYFDPATDTIANVTSVGNVTGTVGGIAGTIQTLDALDAAQDAQHGATQTAVAARPTLAEILAGGDVDGFTLEQTLKICLAALAGKLSGAATTTITIRAADDSKARITATVDADGNRSAVTLDGAA